MYAQVSQHDFVNLDDPDYLTNNPNVARGITGHAVLWALTTGHAANWHPLTWFSHMLDVQLFGMTAGPHHLTNLFLHIVNAILLFALLRHMTGALGRSAFVAGLFAVHPLHVESVAWLAERKDVLSGLFWLLTLWAYFAYVEERRFSRYLLLLIVFALGLMAKPMLVTMPFVLLLLDVWPLGRASFGGDLSERPGPAALSERRAVWAHLVKEKLPLLGLSAASSLVTLMVQQRGGAVSSFALIPFGARAANAAVSYVAYIRKMFWPTQLAVLYPYPRSALRWSAVACSVLLVSLSVLVIAARRRSYLAVGWLWFVGTLVPVIGLVQVGSQAMADRYTYIPLIGLFIIVAWGTTDLLAAWRPRKIALAAAATVVLLALMIAARVQVSYWANSVTLWEHTLEVTTKNGSAHSSIAVALWEQGRVDEAVPHFFEAVRLSPDVAGFHNNLAVMLAKQGQVDEAIREYLEALRLNPAQADWRYNLAVSLNRRGDTAEAVRQLEITLALNPANQKARDMLRALGRPK